MPRRTIIDGAEKKTNSVKPAREENELSEASKSAPIKLCGALVSHLVAD